MAKKSSIFVGSVLVALGILVLAKPEIMAWIVGAYLAISGLVHISKN